MARTPASPESPAAHRALLIVEEDGKRQTFHLEGATTIGREPECDIPLGSPTVSRRHALVAPAGEGWIVRDLGSGNGTFLDARRVDEAPLESGVTIRFGSVPAWFEEEPEAPLTASQKIQRTLTRTLSIQPARRAREKAAVATLAGGVALLLLASAWHRGCDSRADGRDRLSASPGPTDASPAKS